MFPPANATSIHTTSEHNQVFPTERRKYRCSSQQNTQQIQYILSLVSVKVTRHSGEATQHNTEYRSLLKKKKKKKKSTRKLCFISRGMGAEEWSLSVSHLHGQARGLNYYHMGPKGRKRTLLRHTESYGLPDLLAYKINKATATACKFVCHCL